MSLNKVKKADVAEDVWAEGLQHNRACEGGSVEVTEPGGHRRGWADHDDDQPVNGSNEGEDQGLHYLCFWGQGILCWHSYWTTMFGDLKNSDHFPVREVFEVTETFVPWQKCSKFISNRARRRVMATRPLLYCQLYPLYSKGGGLLQPPVVFPL